MTVFSKILLVENQESLSGSTSNTPSSLVLRDADGKFSIGSIKLESCSPNSVLFLDNSKYTSSDSLFSYRSGNLGLGTNTPDAKIHIKSATSSGNIWIDSPDSPGVGSHLSLLKNNQPKFLIGLESGIPSTPNISSNNAVLFTYNTDLIFYTGSSESMRLTAPGRLGIGTNAPAAELHVQGSAIIDGSITITNPLSVSSGGTGTSTSTGSGSVVKQDSPTLITPNLGTPSYIDLTNATNLPPVDLVTDIAGILPVTSGGTGTSTATGTGSVVKQTNAVLITPNLGTPSYIDLTNATNLPTVSLAADVSGILPIASGGTGASSATAAINNLVPNQSGNSGKLLSTDGSNLQWQALGPSQITSSLGYTPVNKAGDTMTGQLILSGSPSTALAAATKQYTDSSDYLNLPPLAGTLSNNSVPVYADFDFSLAAWGSVSHTLVDNEGKIVTFFNTTNVTGAINVFRAYKFSDTDSYKFDGEPVSASFLLPTEKVQYIINAGTFFATLYITTKTAPETKTRVVIVKTGGSSNWHDWTLAVDVTTLHTSNTNYSLIVTPSGDRILESKLATDSSTVTLSVYDASLTLLRSVVVFDRAEMVNNADTTGAGRTAPANFNIAAYKNGAFLYPFGWNPFTQTFYQRFHTWYVGQSGTGSALGIGLCLDSVWSLSLEWIESGSSTPQCLIPVKTGTYRYSQLPDNTWDTQDGGMSTDWGGSGWISSVITDEYTGDMYLTTKNTWSSTEAGDVRRIAYEAGTTYLTLSSYLQPKVTLYTVLNLPDASPWSKIISPTYFHIIDDNILFRAYSTKNQWKLVQANFSTSEFLSVAQGATDDTLKLNSTTATLDAFMQAPPPVSSNFYPGNMMTTVVAGSPVYYHIKPGQKIYTVSAFGADRNYTESALTVPVIPSTLDGITGIAWASIAAWNGDDIAPVYWAVVSDSSGQLYMAKCVSNTWSIPNVTLNLLQAEMDAGEASRLDGLNLIYFGNGQSLLTENGRLLFSYGIPTIGGTTFGWCAYQTANDTAQSVLSVDKFKPVYSGPGGYAQTGGYGGLTFGFSSYFGYYSAIATGAQEAAAIISSKDIRGVIAELSEDEWFGGSVARPQIWVSTQSATGLIAYVYDYPLFIGGYLTNTGNVSLDLLANSDNYIYVTKTNTDRTSISYTVSDKLLPSTFSRVLLAKVTTDSENVISGESYPVRPDTGSVNYTAGSGISLVGNTFSNTGIISLTAGTNISITGTNANKTISFDGTLPVTSGGTGVTTSTGTGSVVLSASPVLVTPDLGTPSAIDLSNATNLPSIDLSTGTTGVLGLASGGTGISTWDTGDLPYYSAGTGLSKLGIGINGYVLTSNGSEPVWAPAPGGTGGSLADDLSGGAAGSIPYQSAASQTEFLPIGTANYVLTSSGTVPEWSNSVSISSIQVNTLTINSGVQDGITYLNASNQLTTDASLKYSGSTLTATGSIAVTDGTNTGEVKIESATFDFNTSSNAVPAVWRLGSTEAMRLAATGLGIGVTSPDTALHVAAAGEQLKVEGVGDSDAVMLLQPSGTAVYSWIKFYNAAGTSYANIVSHSGSALYINTANNGDMFYRTDGTGSHIWCRTDESTEYARINSSGDFGIGTNNPTAKLDVAGSAKVTKLQLGNVSAAETAVLTTSSTDADQVLDTFDTTIFRTAKYLVQVKSGTSYQACELLLIHDGTTVTIVQYADVATGSLLATFDAEIISGTVQLITTPVNAVTTYKVVRTALTA